MIETSQRILNLEAEASLRVGTADLLFGQYEIKSFAINEIVNWFTRIQASKTGGQQNSNNSPYKVNKKIYGSVNKRFTVIVVA